MAIQTVINQAGKEKWYQLVTSPEIVKEFALTKSGLEPHLIPFLYRIWRSSEGTERLLATSGESNIPEIEIQMSLQSGLFTESKHRAEVYKLDEEGKRSNVKLTQMQHLSANNNALFKFEDPSYVMVWKNAQTGKLLEIEIPRFKLKFTAVEKDGVLRAESVEHPGYYIAQNQLLSNLEGISHYLVLENDKGQKKVLFTRQELNKSAGSLNVEETSRDREISDRAISYQKAHIYDVVIGRNEKLSLVPTSEEGRFYLGKMHLWRMDYALAMDTLRGFDSFTRPYTDEERNELISIVTLEKGKDPLNPKGSFDTHPEALATQMYAAYLLLNDQLNYPSDKELPKSIGKWISSSYSMYLKQLGNMSDRLQLRPDEELLILRLLNASDEILVNRLLQLDPIEGRVAQAKLSAQNNADAEVKNEEAIAFIDQSATSSGLEDFIKRFYPEMDLKDDSNFTKIFFKGSKNPVERSLLRPESSWIFDKVYRLVKDETLSNREKNQLYEQVTGKPIPKEELGESGWRQELAKIIDFMIINYEAMRGELDTAMIDRKIQPLQVLRCLLHDPDKFLKYEEILKLKELIAQKKLLELHKAYLIITKILEPAQTIYDSMPPLSLRSLHKPEIIPPQSGIQMPVSTSVEKRLPGLSVPIRMQPIRQIMALPRVDSFLKVSQAEPSLTELEKEQLKAIFVKKDNDAINKEVKKVTDSIEKAYQVEKIESRLYTIPAEKEAQWSKYVHELKAAKEALGKKLPEMEMDLLIAANRIMDKTIKEQGRVLEMQGKGRPEITLDALIQLYWRRDADLFIKANPALTVTDVAKLMDQVTDYLVTATHAQQIGRILTEAAVVNEARNSNAPSEVIDAAVKEMAITAKAQRGYDIREFPQYLVLEHYMNILIRPDQVSNIARLQGQVGKAEAITKTLGITLEMIMGSGKSAVITVLLALLEADGEHLSFGIVPETLLASTVDLLIKRLGEGYGTSIQVLKDDRSTPVNEQNLDRLLKRMETAIVNKQIFLSTSSSVQSLTVKYVELLRNYMSGITTKDRETMEREIVIFQKIFALLKGRGKVIVDEADLIFNVRKELHYTLGDRRAISEATVSQTLDLYELLVLDPEISSKITLEFGTARTGPPYTEKYYREELVPLLVKKALAKLRSTEESLDQLLQTISTDKAQLIESFLSSRHNKPAEAYVSTIADSKVRNALALLREQVQELLPLTLDKLFNINYGPDPTSHLAIPSHGKDDLAIGSEHGTPFETLMYTIQTYLNPKQEIPASIIHGIFESLRSEAIKEVKENPGMVVGNTKAYKKSLSILPKGTPLDLIHFKDQDQQIVAAINGSIRSRLAVLREFLRSRITIFPKTANANPQIYSYLFGKVTGFTGTQWNADTFPEGIDAQSDNLVTGKILNLLWKHKDYEVTVIPTTTPYQVLKELLSLHPDTKSVIIDTAGALRGAKEIDIAKEWLKLTEGDAKPLKGVVFYDKDSEQWVILERGQTKLIPLRQSKIALEDRGTLYDQRHTTGSDIAQAPYAVAVVIINQYTMLRDVEQSVYRMRKIDKGQRTVFSVEADAVPVIINTLESVEGKPVAADMSNFKLKFEHIVRYVVYKQGLVQADNNFRALKQKLKAVLQEEVFAILTDQKVPPEILAHVMGKTEKLFVTENNDSPWDLFGFSEEAVAKEWLLRPENMPKLLGADTFDVLTAIKNDPFLSSRIDMHKVEQRMSEIVVRSKPLLLSTLLSKGDAYGRETEQQKEVEKEAEKEKEKEKVEDVLETKWSPRKHKKLYPEEWISPFHNVLPFYTMGAVMGERAELKPYINFFDDFLIATNNFAHLKKDTSEDLPYVPFGKYQKGVSGVAIVERSPGNLEFIMLDQKDMRDVRTYLGSELGVNNGKISLYNLDNGFDRLGGRNLEELKNNPKVTAGIVQAKFFDGRLDYTDEEIPYLKQWIGEKGVEEAMALFKYIIEKKSETQLRFDGSRVARIFEKSG